MRRTEPWTSGAARPDIGAPGRHDGTHERRTRAEQRRRRHDRDPPSGRPTATKGESATAARPVARRLRPEPPRFRPSHSGRARRVGHAHLRRALRHPGHCSTPEPGDEPGGPAFLTDFTNFNAKTVDSDFTAINNMATGAFATQAKKFFNSSIRRALEKALAESRGQTRDLYVQSETATRPRSTPWSTRSTSTTRSPPPSPMCSASCQPAKVGRTWKISDVTVLEGATPASAGSASGSAGSSVPGQ